MVLLYSFFCSGLCYGVILYDVMAGWFGVGDFFVRI